MMVCLCGTEFCYDCGGTLPRGGGDGEDEEEEEVVVEDEEIERGHLGLMKRCDCELEGQDSIGNCCLFFFLILCVSVGLAMAAIIWKAGPDFWH